MGAIKNFVEDSIEELVLEKLSRSIQKFLKNWNKTNLKKYKKIIFIETSRKIKTKKHVVNNRDWGIENWIEFIKKYKKDYLFVQSLHPDSKLINDVYSFRSDFRQACAVMNHCDFFLGWEGGFVQAAAALKKNALVLFGGWIHPNVTGYNFHTNIYIDIKGSPCGMKNFCEHCNQCRKLITHDEVSKSFCTILTTLGYSDNASSLSESFDRERSIHRLTCSATVVSGKHNIAW